MRNVSWKCGLALIAAMLTTFSASAADDWAVDKAVLRWDVQVTQAPSEPGAGVVVILPDGGILPRPAPDPVVMSGGRELKSEILWFDSNQGLGIVFEPPSGDSATVYLKPASALRTPGSKSAFTPGLLLFTKNTPSASLEGAQQVTKGIPGIEFRMGLVPFIGQRMNLYGTDDNYISYYTGWIRQSKSERIFFCTISDEGSELRIDDRPIASWPGLHKREGGVRGEYGEWLEVTPGLHQIEYFHFEKTGDQEAHALWTSTPITKDHKPSTIPASAYVQSGQARPTGVKARDGRPVAAFLTDCKTYFWFNEKPVNLFRIEPLFASGLPADTAFSWTIDGQGPVTNRDLFWLVEGSDPIAITLSLSSKAGGSRATRMAMIWSTQPGAGVKATPAGASVDNDVHRRIYRDALLAMCRTVPADRDPTANWSPDFWTTLMNVVEPYRGGALLIELFERSRKKIITLKPDDREYLEDLFFETIRYAKPADTVKWVDRLEQEAKERDRKFYWKLAKVDFYLNTATNVVEARREVNFLRASAVSAAENQLVLIRQGDLERMAGNFPEAVNFYSMAQDRYQAMAKVGPGKPGVGEAVKPVGMARNKADLVAQRRQLSSPSSGSSSRSVAPPPSEKWKTFAVHEASFLVTSRDLIRDGFLFEARDVLNAWEVQFPLSKMKGDYSLAEAEFYVAAGIYPRALQILKLARQGTDISSFLPATYALELECLQKMGNDKEAKELAKKVARDFPIHECGVLARRILNDL
jgi:tetratricopeptide (TPR) repeat protein